MMYNPTNIKYNTVVLTPSELKHIINPDIFNNMKINKVKDYYNEYELSRLFLNKRFDLKKPYRLIKDKVDNSLTFIQDIKYIKDDPVEELRNEYTTPKTD